MWAHGGPRPGCMVLQPGCMGLQAWGWRRGAAVGLEAWGCRLQAAGCRRTIMKMTLSACMVMEVSESTAFWPLLSPVSSATDTALG